MDSTLKTGRRRRASGKRSRTKGRSGSSVLLCEAIRRRSLLQFHYGGLARVVAPYCHGISRKGLEVLRAVQVRGSSSSGGLGFGKLWIVARMEHLSILDETFEPDDPHYNPNDSAMMRVCCCV